jgi:hypothetical protein
MEYECHSLDRSLCNDSSQLASIDQRTLFVPSIIQLSQNQSMLISKELTRSLTLFNPL